MSIATKAEIGGFLYTFKFFAQDFNQFHFVERGKNMQSLAELGITIPQAINTILKLTYKNYSEGPKKDDLFPDGNIWIFGSDIDSEEIYIKLSDKLSNNIAKCVSFHKSKYKISYPYRKEVIS